MEARHGVSFTGGCVALSGCGDTHYSLSCVIYKALFGLILQFVRWAYKIMLIRSHCGYYDFGTTCKPRNLLKNGSESRKGQPACIFTVMEWTQWVGTGLYLHWPTKAKRHFTKWRNGVCGFLKNKSWLQYWFKACANHVFTINKCSIPSLYVKWITTWVWWGSDRSPGDAQGLTGRWRHLSSHRSVFKDIWAFLPLMSSELCAAASAWSQGPGVRLLGILLG